LRIGTVVATRAGIFFGWWVVFSSAAIVFLTGGTFFYGFGALFDPLVAEFGWSHAAISFAFSLRSQTGGVAAPIVGFLVDRVGSRRVMVMGVLAVILGFVLLSRVQSLWAFYGAVMVISVGMSSSGGSVGMVAITHWFRRRRGRALAFMAMGSGTSGVMVVVLVWLISTFGWRDALLIIAVVQFAVCVPLALSIRDRPEEIGLRADGEPLSHRDEGGPQAPGAIVDEGLTVSQALHSSAFWRLAGAVALGNVGLMAIIVHQIPFFTDSVGLSESAAAASVTAMVMVSLAGRFGFGYLADLIDKRLVMAGAYTCVALGVLMFAVVFHPWQVVLALPLFGLGWGGIIPVRPAFQAEVFGLRAFGAIQGLVFTVATLGAIVGPVFAGWMYDQTGSYRLAFVILAATASLAIPMLVTLRRPGLPSPDPTPG
jgi:OFA family oxalate/formate antiporter-like MFS transporter